MPLFGRKSTLWVFGFATVCALSLRLFILEDFRVASASMWPGLARGDLVFAYKAAYNVHFPFSDLRLLSLGRPRPGDIALFSVPGESGHTFLKRIVAVEGDRVEIKEGTLWINGERKSPEAPARQLSDSGESLLWEGFGSERYSVVPPRGDFGPVTVPSGHFFALGDNRANSNDSRSWGPVPNSYLKGKFVGVWMKGPRSGL